MSGARIKTLDIYGYKTFRSLDRFEVRPINMLIGVNGAGKSNLISFFRMLSWMLGGQGSLQDYISRQGGASRMLHDGSKTTPLLQAAVQVETDRGLIDYAFSLAYAADDTLIFTDEKFRFSAHGHSRHAGFHQCDAGHKESRLITEADGGNTTAQTILRLIQSCVVFQFHDTSSNSRIRGKWNTNDARYLKEDGANLGAFLYGLKTSENEPYRTSFRRIEDTVRLMAPFIHSFVLEPEHGSVLLQWRERDSDMVFSVSQAADGLLRAIALITLLCQPEDNLPSVLIIDEPELGLHPYTINLVAGLLKRVSLNSQVIVATQSPALLDAFNPEDAVIVERRGRESSLFRKGKDELQEWLKEYSLGELMVKNVLIGNAAP